MVVVVGEDANGEARGVVVYVAAAVNIRVGTQEGWHGSEGKVRRSDREADR